VAIDIRIRLGRRLRELRTKSGWNQAYFAEITGFGKIYISQLENGHKTASIATVEILATAFSMTISEFTKGL